MSKFDSFCSRMWLDHCDENNDVLSTRLTLEEYKDLYMWWLIGIFYKREWLAYE